MTNVNTTQAPFKSGEHDGDLIDPNDMPNIYALNLVGTCMEPELKSGDVVACSPVLEYKPGDLVCLFFDEIIPHEGNSNVMLKRLVMPPMPGYKFGRKMIGDIKPVVIVEQINPHRHLAIDCNHLLGIHKCLGLYERDQKQDLTLTPEEWAIINGHDQAA